MSFITLRLFNLPSVFNNVLLLTISMSLVYMTYCKLVQAFKERIKIRARQWTPIINSSWQVVCSIFMIIICYYGIFSNLPSAVKRFSFQETNQTLEVAFPSICAFHFHSVYLSCKYNGLNKLSLRWMLATVALCLSYGAKCLKIGITNVLVWSMISLIMETICLSISISEMIHKKPMGAKLSLSIAVFFSIIWAIFYLYLYPLFILLPVSALNSNNSSVSLISLLLLTLWSVYLLDWCSTPLVRFLWMAGTRTFPTNWLSSLFLNQKSDVTEKLLLIRKGEMEKEQSMSNSLVHSEEAKTRQNSQTMVQTIRCVLLLKKKLRRMREKKHLKLSDESQNN